MIHSGSLLSQFSLQLYLYKSPRNSFLRQFSHSSQEDFLGLRKYVGWVDTGRLGVIFYHGTDLIWWLLREISDSWEAVLNLLEWKRLSPCKSVGSLSVFLFIMTMMMIRIMISTAIAATDGPTIVASSTKKKTKNSEWLSAMQKKLLR